MKTKIENYIFNKTSKQITFVDYEGIRLDAVLLITNATDSTIIFNFADPTKGGTVSGNILTLAFDTSSMSDSDKLLIYYDDTEKTDLTAELIETLQELIQRLAPLGGAMQSGQPYLRITGNVVATGGGYITSAQMVAALLTHSIAMERYSANAVHSNINNAVGA